MKTILALFFFLLITGYAQAGSRDDFINNVLPLKYPQLLKYLKVNEKLKVNWLSQTGENQSQILKLKKDGTVVIKTKMYGGSTGNMKTPVNVIMMDKNGDSRLDYIEYHMQGQNPHVFNNPTDESSLFLWNTALAITMKYSNCCKK